MGIRDEQAMRSPPITKCIIILKKIIDPEILGGIYVRIGNDVIDGTVRTRLDDLRKLMLTTE